MKFGLLVTTATFFSIGVTAAHAQARAMDAAAINAATFEEWREREDTARVEDTSEEATRSEADGTQAHPDPFLLRMQILLDRTHASTGVLDGYLGENMRKAIRVYEERNGLPVDGEPDAEIWALLEKDTRPTIVEYEIVAGDEEGPFVDEMPSDYADMAEMNWLGYRGVREMLAERHHMDEDLLASLNADASFSEVGTTVLVADVGGEPDVEVTKIVVDKDKAELRAYDGAGNLVVSYPATIGSPDNPSPSGSMVVDALAPEPNYTYDPDTNFKQGDNEEKMILPPGPNGPVGIMWINLSEPTYGIHGTPEPSKIDKTGSHGCVRLTNWDAMALADLVKPETTTVEFVGEDPA